MNVQEISEKDWREKLVVNIIEPISQLPLLITDVERFLGIKFKRYWEDGLGEFAGIAIAIDDFDLVIKGPLDKEMGASIYVRGNEPQPKLLLQHVCKVLNIEYRNLKWISDIVDGERFVVSRLDDNSNEIDMDVFLTERGAKSYAKEYESRGHKQIYSVRKAT